MFINAITAEAQLVLNKNQMLIANLVSGRRRFENWLQLEIYKGILKSQINTGVEIEKSYPKSQERCDFWSNENGSRESWVELKLYVTNYSQEYTSSSSTRPITNQVSEIIRDVDKLQRIPRNLADRHILLIVYSMPLGYESHPAWAGHLSRIQASASSIEEKFSVTVKKDGKTSAVVSYVIAV